MTYEEQQKEWKKKKDKIISMRESGMTLDAIGKVFNVSRQRIKQIVTPNYSYYYKQVVKDRDKNKCQMCGKKETLHVHHLDRDTFNNKHDNLITLCKECHTKIHTITNRLRKLSTVKA
jgi:5-methylcytosine-specific restriction endonuclease McrA